jgi:tetratricopeptide (TPR) repeat protein
VTSSAASTARPAAGPWRWLAAAGLLLATAAGLQAFALAQRPTQQLPAVLYLQTPEVARRAVLSFDMLAADLYWMRALQHFGATRLRTGGPRRFENLHPFLDLATSLDARFNIAYRFGAIFLSEQPPGGPGRPDQAIALLEKGIAANPHRWEYHQDIGFVHYWWTGDYTKAADAFSRGAAVPGAPWWMKSLAAVTLTQGGDRNTSRLLWRALAQTPDNEFLRRDAQRRLVQLDALDRIDALQALVDKARAAGATAPWSWPQLFQAGYLRQLPVDTTGVPFAIDMTTGRVDVHRHSSLWPMPVEPRKAAGRGQP